MKSEDMLIPDLRTVKVGDKLMTVVGNILTVTDIDESRILTKHATVKSYRISLDSKGYRLRNGKRLEDRPLVFFPFEGQWPTIKACTRPVPKFDIDTKLLCWLNGRWEPAHFYDVEDGELFTFEDGRSSFTDNREYVPCRYWILAADETINSGNLEDIGE